MLTFTVPCVCCYILSLTKSLQMCCTLASENGCNVDLDRFIVIIPLSVKYDVLVETEHHHFKFCQRNGKLLSCFFSDVLLVWDQWDLCLIYSGRQRKRTRGVIRCRRYQANLKHDSLVLNKLRLDMTSAALRIKASLQTAARQ